MGAKVYAVRDGAELNIGSYGVASRLPKRDDKGKITGWVDTPVTVPDEVADEMEAAANVERDVPNPDWREGADEKVTPRLVKVKVPAEYRVERETKRAAAKDDAKKGGR